MWDFFNFWSLSPIDFFKSKTEICVPVLSLHIAFLQALSNLGKTIIYSVSLADDFFVPVHWHRLRLRRSLGNISVWGGEIDWREKEEEERMSGWHGDPILFLPMSHLATLFCSRKRYSGRQEKYFLSYMISKLLFRLTWSSSWISPSEP